MKGIIIESNYLKYDCTIKHGMDWKRCRKRGNTVVLIAVIFPTMDIGRVFQNSILVLACSILLCQFNRRRSFGFSVTVTSKYVKAL